MTNQDEESQESAGTGGISDEDLPDDVVASEDNPLAEPLEPGETADPGLNEPSRTYAKEMEEKGSGESHED